MPRSKYAGVAAAANRPGTIWAVSKQTSSLSGDADVPILASNTINAEDAAADPPVDVATDSHSDDCSGDDAEDLLVDSVCVDDDIDEEVNQRDGDVTTEETSDKDVPDVDACDDEMVDSQGSDEDIELQVNALATETTASLSGLCEVDDVEDDDSSPGAGAAESNGVDVKSTATKADQTARVHADGTPNNGNTTSEASGGGVESVNKPRVRFLDTGKTKKRKQAKQGISKQRASGSRMSVPGKAKAGKRPRKAPGLKKPTGSPGGLPSAVAKKRRFRAGTVSLREIKKMQKSVDQIIPLACFNRLVRDIMVRVAGGHNGMRMTKGARDALQEAAEDHIVRTLRQSYVLSINRGASTLEQKDMQYLQMILTDN